MIKEHLPLPRDEEQCLKCTQRWPIWQHSLRQYWPVFDQEVAFWFRLQSFKGQNVTIFVYHSDLLSKVHRLSSYSCIFWTFWWSVEFCEKQSKLSNTESKTDVLITTIGQKTRKTREPISTGNSNKYRQLIGPSEKTKKIVKNSRTKCFRGKKWVRRQIMD